MNLSAQRAERHNRAILTVIVMTCGALGIAWVVKSIRQVDIAEAYAAWDTGTLLIEFLKTHNDRWPGSWDELLTVLDSEAGRQIPLWGAQAGDLPYARSLRAKVAVDWTYDLAHPDRSRPVTRPDGSAFHTVWSGAEPNEMVRDYLKHRAATQSTK